MGDGLGKGSKGRTDTMNGLRAGSQNSKYSPETEALSFVAVAE